VLVGSVNQIFNILAEFCQFEHNFAYHTAILTLLMAVEPEVIFVL
jgi:hypothetical protein